MDIKTKLFNDWELDTWANVLEVVGFALSILGVLISLFIKSELNKLRTRLLLDSRIKDHIKNLDTSKSKLNSYFNSYDHNLQNISSEFGLCQSELEDILGKLNYWQGWKIRRLKNFIRNRRQKHFAIKRNFTSLEIFFTRWIRRIYETNYDDSWEVYERLLECLRQLENIKKNNLKSP